MKTSLRGLVATSFDELKASYWLVPSLMTLVAIACGVLFPWIDEAIGASWPENLSWVSASKAEGARAVLSTLAGSMITVAGVSFSITIAAVAYASAQLGPRLLNNFLRDRGNQGTLGTFISTFVYCLMILRTIRDGESGAGFVPHLSVTVAVVLALVNVGVLIFFVHHVPSSIRASSVVAGIGAALERDLAKQFDHHGDAAEQPPIKAWDDIGDSVVVAIESGALRFIDFDDLVAIAQERRLRLSTELIPGDFVLRGQRLVRIHGHVGDELDGELEKRIQGAFLAGPHRTQSQDVRFLINELVEIAARALSPGVNDPFTAIQCIDWLAAGLRPAMVGTPKPHVVIDAEGHERLMRVVLDARALITCGFGKLQPYVSRDANVTVHMLATLGKLLRVTKAPTLRSTLVEHATSLHAEAASRLNEVAFERVDAAHSEFLALTRAS